jgi:hypothetical protein
VIMINFCEPAIMGLCIAKNIVKSFIIVYNN